MRHILLALLATTGCAVDALDDQATTGGKADGNGTCEEPMYGDGTCQMSLACGIVDIDCFRTFADDAEAATWFATVDAAPLVAATSADHQRARTLLDKAWTLYSAAHRLGTLADARPAVVVVDTDDVNAFAYGDEATNKQPLVVVVYRGLLAPAYTDNAILGMLTHEFGHIEKLHSFPDVIEDLQRYYVAAQDEPIGARQPDQANVRQAVRAWQDRAYSVGWLSAPVFESLPLFGDYAEVLAQIRSELGVSSLPCAASSLAAVKAMVRKIEVNELDDSVVPSPALVDEARQAMTALATCATAAGLKLNNVTTNMGGDWASWIAEEAALAGDPSIATGDAVQGLLALVGFARGKLRTIETDFTAQSGVPWSAVRWFTREEQADDQSALAMLDTGAAVPGQAEVLRELIGAEQTQKCEDARAAGLAPYGLRLTDDHHGMCWRIDHQYRIWADRADNDNARVALPSTLPTGFVPTRRVLAGPID